MSVALVQPVRDAIEAAPSALVFIATVGAAILAIWAMVVKLRKTRLSQWVKRRILVPVWTALYTKPRAEKLAASRVEANARIVLVVKEAIAPLATKVDEIAHSTNGKADGAPTMSAEITALTETVGEIAKGMAAHRIKIEEMVGEQAPRFAALEASQKVAATLLSDLADRVTALEGKPAHDPHPQAADPDAHPHRRHDD